MKKLLSSLFILLLLVTSVIAQERTVTGTVKGQDDGLPLPGVSVRVKGTTAGTQTGANGQFSISVPGNNAVLVFTYIGYAAQEVTVGSKTAINVLLSSDANQLSEVVVTALGIERDTRSLGYAVQTVKGDDLAQRSESNVLNTLQGKISGVNIGSASGAPGASTNINIRGITSFNGSNQPLIVVDGIVFSNDTDNSQTTLFGSTPSNRLNDLNPESIESINVLKGPAASVLYGSRASAGVIVITTKSGKALGGKTEVTFSSSANFQNVSYLPKLQNLYGQGANNNFVNNSSNSWGPAFGTPGLESVTTVWGETVPYQAYPNNVKDFFTTGQLFQNSLNLASGDRDKNFAVSLSSTIQDGIVRESGFNRHNVQVNGNSKLNNGIILGGAITYVKTNQRNATTGNGGSAFGQITRLPRSFDLMGMPYKDELGNSIYFSTSGQNHPLWSLENEFFTSDVDRAFGNVSIGYDFADWLNVSYRITADTYTDRRKQVLRNGAARAPEGQLDEDLRFRSELNGDLMIRAAKDDILTSGLNASLLLGHNINQRKFQQSGVIAESLTIPGFDNVSNGSVFNQSYESNTTRRLVGYYGQLSMDYNSYLFLELSGRVDQSSTLPKDQSAYFYPAASLSFVPTDAFDIRSNVLSYLKVRASAAKVGRDADPYLLQSFYVQSSYGNNVADIVFPISVGNSSIPGFQVSSRIGSQDLTPEFVTSYEGGVNFGLFRNRLGLDFTYFYTNSTNQIFNVSVSSASGYDSRTTNIGKMTNKGIEASISATPIKSQSFTWDILANFTRIRNKVVDITAGVETSDVEGDAFGGIIPSIVKGHPYGVIVGSANARNEAGELLINPSTGLFMPAVAGSVIANPHPDWIGGLTNTFTYKNFSLSALIDFREGGQLYSFSQTDLRTGGVWEPTGVDREQPRILPGVIANGDGTFRPNNIQISSQSYWNGLGGLASEGAVYDATAYRLREVSLTYSLPSSVLAKTPFGNASIGFSARNLFLWAPGFPSDPELNTQGAGNIQGLDLNGIPATKTYGFNLRVTF